LDLNISKGRNESKNYIKNENENDNDNDNDVEISKIYFFDQ
jgi:hypothetical protein